MQWTVHGERYLYDSEWVRLALVDVGLPSGMRFEHHVIRMPFEAAGVVVDDPDRGVLLLWRHRFITDTWGWEAPAGRVDPGETAIEAAERETLEETGWRPGPLEPLVRYYPSNGMSDAAFNLFVTTSATHIGDPADADESERIEFLPWVDVKAEIAAGRITDGFTLTGLLHRLTM